jgi:type I restriction enzyme R subunit
MSLIYDHSELLTPSGTGQNYLIQHSAGSGKSNSIAWLAHQLANLCGADGQPVFDSIIVITDRRVLDKQLQETIKQFEKIKGTVSKIDKNTRQLVKALERGDKIIITTLQKFGFVGELAKLPGKCVFAAKRMNVVEHMGCLECL